MHKEGEQSNMLSLRLPLTASTTLRSSTNRSKSFPNKVSSTNFTSTTNIATTSNNSSSATAVSSPGLGPDINGLDVKPKSELMPKHVAVIMDGHGRWAMENGLPIERGHRTGAQKIKILIRLCAQYGVKVLTLFAFSTENWVRPKDEVDILMKLFLEQASSRNNVDELRREGVRVSFIGDKSMLSKPLRNTLNLVENITKSNTRLHLMVALNYSGQYDILQATKRIASKVKDGVVQVEDIDRSLFEQQLETNRAEIPNPDLLIRTSGEQRISNFLLWQLAYSELYFAKKPFPEMEEADFMQALTSFQLRQRRYGGRV